MRSLFDRHRPLSRRGALGLTAALCGIAMTRQALAATDILSLPTFTLKPFSLEPVTGLTDIPAPSLDALLGEVSVLNFWGAWCPACRNEHKLLLKLRDDGLRIVGIDYNDTDAEAVAYLTREGNPFTFVGKAKRGDALMEMLGVNSFPQTFVVGRKAEVIWQSTGTLAEEELDDIRNAVEAARALKA